MQLVNKIKSSRNHLFRAINKDRDTHLKKNMIGETGAILDRGYSGQTAFRDVPKYLEI